MNFGTPVPLLIGIVLVIGAVGLFFLDKLRPGYARDSDKVYAVLLLLSGVLTLTNLDMDLGESFQSLLMSGMLFALMVEGIRRRSPQDEPVRSVSGPPPPPRRPEPRPNRRPYRAELDDWEQPGSRRPIPPRSGYGDYNDPYYQRSPYDEPRRIAGRLNPTEMPDQNFRDLNAGFDQGASRGLGPQSQRPGGAQLRPNYPSPQNSPPDETQNGVNVSGRGPDKGRSSEYRPNADRPPSRPPTDNLPDNLPMDEDRLTADRWPDRRPNGRRPDQPPQGGRDPRGDRGLQNGPSSTYGPPRSEPSSPPRPNSSSDQFSDEGGNYRRSVNVRPPTSDQPPSAYGPPEGYADYKPLSPPPEKADRDPEGTREFG